MIFKKKEKESNYALLRRFNRELLIDGKLIRAKEGQFFTKPQTRRQKQQAAVIRQQMRESNQSY